MLAPGADITKMPFTDTMERNPRYIPPNMSTRMGAPSMARGGNAMPVSRAQPAQGSGVYSGPDSVTYAYGNGQWGHTPTQPTRAGSPDVNYSGPARSPAQYQGRAQSLPQQPRGTPYGQPAAGYGGANPGLAVMPRAWTPGSTPPNRQPSQNMDRIPLSGGQSPPRGLYTGPGGIMQRMPLNSQRPGAPVHSGQLGDGPLTFGPPPGSGPFTEGVNDYVEMPRGTSPPFAQSTVGIDGQTYDDASQAYVQRDALIERLNNAKGKYVSQGGVYQGQGSPPASWGQRPQYDFQQLLGEANDMVQQGWTNPFSQPAGGQAQAGRQRNYDPAKQPNTAVAGPLQPHNWAPGYGPEYARGGEQTTVKTTPTGGVHAEETKYTTPGGGQATSTVNFGPAGSPPMQMRMPYAGGADYGRGRPQALSNGRQLRSDPTNGLRRTGWQDYYTGGIPMYANSIGISNRR